MNTDLELQTLSSFLAKIEAKTRISFADVQRLRRDLLADGIRTREEAELLIALDGRIAKTDPAWTPWLIATIVDFVVWGERPTGIVHEATARWLAATLLARSGRAAAKTAKLILREIAEEAQAFENEALSALVDGALPRPAVAAPLPVEWPRAA